MTKVNFLTAQERAELEGVLRRHREEYGIARRANALLLLDDGKSCEDIATFLYLDDDTIRGWRKQYLSGGFSGVFNFDWKGRIGFLSETEESELALYLTENLPRDTNEVRDHIRRTYHQYYSKSGAIKLMYRLGFEYKRPESLPAVANEEAQREFIEKYNDLQHRKSDDEVIYFADAVHPEYQSKPSHGWFKNGEKVAIKRTSGRKRVNIHGALNLENFDCPFVEPLTVNGESTIHLLEKLEARNPGKKIHVILDNAAYHHARMVKKWLGRKENRINLIFMPPYAPHLNSIERLWGVMHRYVTHNKFYVTANKFTEAILSFLKNTVPKEWKDFRDTVTDNFRVISHQNFRVLA
jgi:transposase